MTAYMDHKDLANETIDAARIQEITDGAHRVLDLIAQTEFTSGREEIGHAAGGHEDARRR